MPRLVEEFKKLASEQVYSSIQRQNGPDLTGMVIVDSTIFKAILDSLSEDELYKIYLSFPMKPYSSELKDVSKWGNIYFDVIRRLDPSIKTQSDFGIALGLTQSDVSSLLSARKGFYFGADRVETLFTNIKSYIEKARKKVS